ncbi:MAG: DUF4340 domain-containing protein [candidate division Zixibacteria bacterium]|nr:DUF4340 domain-containing protein [candidate division Zixibacteria bacterium]
MKKPIYVLIAVFLLFVTIYLVLVQKEKKTFSPRTVENFLGLDSVSVNRIEFIKYDTKMVFQKIGQQWYIVEPDSYRADNKAIGQLVSLASHLTVGEIISSNPEKQILFQVDSLTGTGLDFFSGDRQLASVVVGKMSDDYMHAYLRKTGSEDVYLAKGFFSSITQQRVDHWRDRQILAFDPGLVTEVEFTQGKDKFKLTREDTVWQLSAPPYRETATADHEKTEDYIRTLAEIRSDKFPLKNEIVGMRFENPELVIKLTFADGHEEKLLATKASGEGNRYFVKTDQSESVFVLFEYNYKRLAKKLEDFQPEAEES